MVPAAAAEPLLVVVVLTVPDPDPPAADPPAELTGLVTTARPAVLVPTIAGKTVPVPVADVICVAVLLDDVSMYASLTIYKVSKWFKGVRRREKKDIRDRPKQELIDLRVNLDPEAKAIGKT